MDYRIFLTLLVLLLFPINAGNADEQAEDGYVMRVADNSESPLLLSAPQRAFIDLGNQSGIQIGEIVSIYEEEEVFHPITQQEMGIIEVEIGRAQVVEVYDEGALIEITKKEPGKEVQIAHRVKRLPQEAQQAIEPSGNSTDKLPTAFGQPSSLSNKLFWPSLITGSVFSMGALYYHRQANISYKQYNTAMTPEDAEKYRKQTIKRDQRKRALAGISSVVFVSSFILFWRGGTSANVNSLITPSNDFSLTLSPGMNIVFRWIY